MPTEADTCRTYVLPKLYRADWKHNQIKKQELGQLLLSVSLLDEQQRIIAYLDGLQAKVTALRELQSASREELDALLPSMLRPQGGGFKGEL